MNIDLDIKITANLTVEQLKDIVSAALRVKYPEYLVEDVDFKLAPVTEGYGMSEHTRMVFNGASVKLTPAPKQNRR